MQKYSQYLDSESGIITKPTAYTDIFGDAVWRSSWFYASLIILKAKNPAIYNKIASEHGVVERNAGIYLKYLRDNCLGDDGWKMPKSDNVFSRDQLIPLLYLMMAVSYYAPEIKPICLSILESLNVLEKNGKGVSKDLKGALGRNIGYMIAVLCDKDRYNIDYETKDFSLFLLGCGNKKCAVENRMKMYKKAYSFSLIAFKVGGDLRELGLDIVDEYSVFNALASVTMQCIAWGKNDDDVKKWRKNFDTHANNGWGPAFRIIADQNVSNDEIEEYYDAHVKREQDNDIIMAQRPTKIKDGTLHTKHKGGEGQWITLDYIVLQAFKSIWS